MVQRYFIRTDQMTEDTVVLAGADARHLTKVLRAATGDSFIASDGIKRDVLAKVERVEKDQVLARIIEELPREHEPNVDVVIAQSLPKGDKLELVIQKCTELGAAAFQPFTSERTVVRYDHKKEAKKLERWHKIAKEAAEQSGRNRVPEVRLPVSMKELLQQSQAFDHVYVCYENQREQGIKPVLQQLKEAQTARVDRQLSVMLIVGPEGGFSAAEIRAAEAAGTISLSLGKRILRTETAPIAALACILYELDQMGG